MDAFADPVAGARRVLTIDEQAAWSGVGRLNHSRGGSRGGYCSGALIAPDRVLTAAHCVLDEATGEPIPVRDLRFVAGLRTGVYTAHRRATAAHVHPDWAGFKGDGKVIVAGDIAMVRLETPITDIEARTFRTGPPPGEGDPVTLVSYGRGRDGALSIQSPCYVLKRWRHSLEMNCDSVFGTSGAPVFDMDGRVVGVISASDDGAREKGRSFAVIVEGAIDAIGGAGARPATVKRPEGAVSTLFRKAPTGGSRLPGGKKAPTR